MKIGDKLYLTPHLVTSALKMERNGPQPCRVIAINEKHRHFTVEFDFNGHPIRETYKIEAL